jgi:hypothetical protein
MVVPITMKIRPLQINCGQFSVTDFDAGWIITGVEFGLDLETLLGRGGCNQINDAS